MIGALSGKVSAINSNIAIIDVGGVGYEVALSKAASALCDQIGNGVNIIIYTDVRENSISLFGFSDHLEKQVFLLTKKVKGIGSKSALSIISALGADGLLIAIGQGDIGRLQKIPGVGKKTAERIIVELREQVSTFVQEITASFDTEDRETTAIGDNIRALDVKQKLGGTIVKPFHEDAILALEKLGVSTERARNAVQTVIASGINIEDSGELVKYALSNL